MERLVKNFLFGIFDYAGFFPPASLPLEKAMVEYIKYRQSEYDWLMSHFVILHTSLGDLYDLSAREPELPDPLRLAIVSTSSETVNKYLEQLAIIEHNIIQIHKSLHIKLKTDVLEIKLPDEIHSMNSIDEICELLDLTVDSLGKNLLLPEAVFFEIPGFEYSRDTAHKVIDALKIHNEGVQIKAYEFYHKSGFKIRCGGTQAHQFPPADYLASAISVATNNKVPLKYTAGLHHPYRAYNESVKTEMHGFVNVLGASFFSAAQKLSEDEMEKMLLDEDPADFSFNNEVFEWGGHSISLKEIKEIRNKEITTIGSCSISEPIKDLRALNLLV